MNGAFCLQMTVKPVAIWLHLKFELFLKETLKTFRVKIVAKTLMKTSSNLIKVEYHRDIVSHGRFRKSFRKL